MIKQKTLVSWPTVNETLVNDYLQMFVKTCQIHRLSDLQ